MNGPSPILPQTVMNWCRATGYQLCCEEIEIMFKVDVVYLRAYAVEQERQAESEKLRQTTTKAPEKIDG